MTPLIVISLVVFCVGLTGVLLRRDLPVQVMSLELLLGASALAFVAGSLAHGLKGQSIALLIAALAAAEVAVGLSLSVMLSRVHGTLDADKARSLGDEEP